MNEALVAYAACGAAFTLWCMFFGWTSYSGPNPIRFHLGFFAAVFLLWPIALVRVVAGGGTDEIRWRDGGDK